jgi:hypothetical protein
MNLNLNYLQRHDRQAWGPDGKQTTTSRSFPDAKRAPPWRPRPNDWEICTLRLGCKVQTIDLTGNLQLPAIPVMLQKQAIRDITARADPFRPAYQVIFSEICRT